MRRKVNFDGRATRTGELRNDLPPAYQVQLQVSNQPGISLVPNQYKTSIFLGLARLHLRLNWITGQLSCQVIDGMTASSKHAQSLQPHQIPLSDCTSTSAPHALGMSPANFTTHVLQDFHHLQD